MIKREKYLKKIRGFYDQDLIKVITGIRRSGKSTLLKQIIDELKDNGVIEERIIYINFEDIDMSFIKNGMDLNDYIKKQIKNDEKYYLFFDEIQNIIDWEKAVNSFKTTKNVSIFITGSNSNLLSGELATLLAGRYVSFKIQPFSFKEVCELKGIEDKTEIEKAFEDYIKWGGMPQRFYFKDEQETKNYLMDLYDSIVVKDVISRYKVKDVELLNKILEYLMSTPAQQFSVTNIVNYLKNENRNCSNETLYNYLSYITNSFIMNKAKRYDIKGKRVLSTNDKYYLTDLGLGQVKSSIKTKGKGSILENIVYNELLNRGYEVLVGKSDSSEIDFIASYFDEKIYVQVAYILADDSIVEREFGAFKGIEDNYPKYVLTMDKFNFSQNGIIHKNVIDWLLEDK